MTAGISSAGQDERRQVAPAAPMAAWPAGEHAQAWSPGAQEAAAMAEVRQLLAQLGMDWACARRGRAAAKRMVSFILRLMTRESVRLRCKTSEVERVSL